jgi:predicted dehydrogenase
LKAILVGLGSAGFSWYKRLRDQGMLLAVVEADPAMKEKMRDDPFPFYTSLEDALDREKADFLVNVTSPAAHTPVNVAAFDKGLPVLCEKPISFQYEESLAVVARAEKDGIPFMIAENYRHFPSVRRFKELLAQGTIGDVSSVDVRFARYHRVQRKYPVSVLDDIGVHHMDMLRYFTGREGYAVQARLFAPIGAWQEDGAVIAANAMIEMTGGIAANYSATIASRGPMTPWYGDWRIEGERGALMLENGIITIYRDGETEQIREFSSVPTSDPLTEFLASLREGRESETSGTDYLKTQALVYYTNVAASTGQRTRIELGRGQGKDLQSSISATDQG